MADHSDSGQAGFTIVELIVALMILTIGILGLFSGFDTARKLSVVSEHQQAMAHVAQQQIELLEGNSYANLGLSSDPASSTDPTNPDYYITTGTPPQLQYDRATSTAKEPIVDASNLGGSGTASIAPTATWSQGGLSGTVYRFITWTNDITCGSSCPASNDYKRITVAVTISGGVQPTPVWVSSLIADPAATGQAGTPSNPLKSPATTCTNSAGTTVSCTDTQAVGTPNTYYLHDWPATSSGTESAVSADHATHQTVGVASGKTCTTNTGSASGSNIAGCPVPDAMNTSLPPSSTTLYHYSTDIATSGYSGGRLFQQTCPTQTTACGTDSTSDCTSSGWSSSFQPTQAEFFVTPVLSSSMVLNGQGAASIYTQTLNGSAENVSFCLEIYDVPPSGTAGSLADINAWTPVDLGGAAYVPATNPSTATNWQASLGQLNFTFDFLAAGATKTIPSGDRIGALIWMKSSTTNPIAVAYDETSYPSQLQLNSQ